MNRKSTLGLLALLVCLVGVYFIVQWTAGGGRSKSYKEELVEIDTAKISKIEITSTGNRTLIEKQGTHWTTEGKPAKWASISSMFGALKSIKPTRLAARSEDKWKDFQVDSSGTQITLYEGNNKSLDLIIGRFGVEGQRNFYTYVRLADDVDTYVAANFMGMSVGKTSADYREDMILKLKKDSITAIDFNYLEQPFSLVKSLEGAWIIEGQVADSANLATYFRDLNYLTSKNFANTTGLPTTQDITFQLKNGKSIQISDFSDGSFGSSENQFETFLDEVVKGKIFKEKYYFLKN